LKQPESAHRLPSLLVPSTTTNFSTFQKLMDRNLKSTQRAPYLTPTFDLRNTRQTLHFSFVRSSPLQQLHKRETPERMRDAFSKFQNEFSE